MFINLSSDNIYIIINNEKIVLWRGKLEREISQIIIDLYHTYLPIDIYIINGPGSFTNLRLWCLAINLLSYLLEKTNQSLPNIYTIDKFSLYKIFDLSILIYIWQKNNYRLLNNGEIQKVNINDMQGEKIYLDDLSDNIYMWLPKISFDYIDSKICMIYDDLHIMDVDNNKNITWLFTLCDRNISPNYMIEPNIS